MGAVGRLDHIAVSVSDLDRSLRFYRDILGFEEVERHRLEGETISTMAAKPCVVLQVVRLRPPEGAVLLDLQQYIQPKGTVSNAQIGMANHSHFCFEVKDIQGTYTALRAKGVEFVSEPVTFDLGGEEPQAGVLHVVFLRDPDGFILELVEFPRKSS